MQNESKICQNCKNSFNIEPDDFAFYEKMKVPVPHVCPDCRFKMRALFRNETTLYSGRTCGLCSKSIVTMYNPKSPYTIYCQDCFYSDKWDPKSYAKDYDPSRSFIEQMKELLIKVPKINLYCTSGEGPNINSDYVNMVSGCKNCYLIFNTSNGEELLYSRGVREGRFSSDIYFGTSFENSYESVNIQQSSGVLWSQNVISCVDCAFIYNCSGLTNCFGCVNLRNQSYCFLNQHLSKEEYDTKLKKVLGSYKEIEAFKKEFDKFKQQFPHKENSNLKTVDSKGDYLFECKNVHDSFEITKSEDCRYLFSSKNIKDSLGTIGYGTSCERLLEVVAVGHSSNIIGSYGPENCRDIVYGFYIKNCQNCIGCDGVQNSKYMILNKEYSKEEYESLKDHIVKELTEKNLYGLIMPPELAPFAYNETIAQTNFPLSKEEVLNLGFRWEDDVQITKSKETIQPEEIEDNIKNIVDSITQEVFKCISCERNYKIIEQEFLFYKKMSIPIPRKCFYCRYDDRIIRRGPYKFWDRKCAHCDKDIKTNYSPDRPEIVYCEKCYQQEVM